MHRHRSAEVQQQRFVASITLLIKEKLLTEDLSLNINLVTDLRKNLAFLEKEAESLRKQDVVLETQLAQLHNEKIQLEEVKSFNNFAVVNSYLFQTKSSLQYELEIASKRVSSLVVDHRIELENFAKSKKCSEESLLHEIEALR